MSNSIDIVFSARGGVSTPPEAVFVEVERNYESIKIGEWHRRDDGFLVLRIPDPVQDPFLEAMKTELRERADREHPPINSYHEGYGVILEELDEFWDIVRMKTKDRNREDARHELVQVAVTAWRTARDVLKTE